MISSLVYWNLTLASKRKQFLRHFGEQVPRNPGSECTFYPLLHFSSSLPIPTGSSPVTALPFSPGVVRLPSHHVMTCRLSDPARGETARFEPRNDRHRWPEEDEEKDSASEIRQKWDGTIEGEAEPPKDSNISNIISEANRTQRTQLLGIFAIPCYREIDTGERRSSLFRFSSFD